MAEHLISLAQIVCSKIRILGFSSPGEPVVRELLRIAYLASLRTEEARFVRGSLTFADPDAPNLDPPIIRRAKYPKFSAFGRPVPLTVESVVKLSRAVDNWSGSIAVFGTGPTDLTAWGIVDQIVHQNIVLNRESTGGPANPGILTVNMDGIAELSIYHDFLFLGAVKQDRVVVQENDALNSKAVQDWIRPRLAESAFQIANALDSILDYKMPDDELISRLSAGWGNALARIVIGLRRSGTGGAVILSPKPLARSLDIKYKLEYRRLSDSFVLGVLDGTYAAQVRERIRGCGGGVVPQKLVLEGSLAATDFEDREKEITGAVKVVASLGAVDGVVLMNPMLVVNGFGVKIKSNSKIESVYDGPDFARNGTAAECIDTSRYGTRHGSVLRYCRRDADALGLIVSQDGNVRLVMSVESHLTFWDDVRILQYSQHTEAYAEDVRRARKYRDVRREKSRLGYTSTPKTIEELQRYTKSKKPR